MIKLGKEGLSKGNGLYMKMVITIFFIVAADITTIAML
jgi:hypothetical protein